MNSQSSRELGQQSTVPRRVLVTFKDFSACLVQATFDLFGAHLEKKTKSLKEKASKVIFFAHVCINYDNLQFTLEPSLLLY